eukprot:531443-Rhodomonas_salina.5
MLCLFALKLRVFTINLRLFTLACAPSPHLAPLDCHLTLSPQSASFQPHTAPVRSSLGHSSHLLSCFQSPVLPSLLRPPYLPPSHSDRCR